MIEEYYKPSEIRFDKDSIIWLLPHLPMLGDGDYPKDPRETGYTDAPINKRQVRGKAPFITAAEIYVELTARLDYCELDGKLVYGNYVDGIDIDKLAKAADLDFYEVVKRINQCLNYISSGHDRRWHSTPKRRGITYKEWIERR